MLGYNKTITRTNINVLINIGPGAGGGRKRTGKKGNLPNTFDDDCSFVVSNREKCNRFLDFSSQPLLIRLNFRPTPPINQHFAFTGSVNIESREG